VFTRLDLSVDYFLKLSSANVARRIKRICTEERKQRGELSTDTEYMETEVVFTFFGDRIFRTLNNIYECFDVVAERDK